MNRPIKFRAWDKITQKFIYAVPTVKQTILEYDNSANSLVLQQFTGLTDRHGKEIYEGDILRINKFLGKVVYDLGKGAFRIVSLDPEDIATLGLGVRTAHQEVIGNVFENPELLEA